MRRIATEQVIFTPYRHIRNGLEGQALVCDRLIFTCGHCGATHDREELQRGLYVGQQSIGDLHALERGGALGLGKRLARRKVTRTLMRGLWRN
jgi:hypothetical protein